MKIENVILITVLVVAGLIYILPMAAGLYIERQDRKKRGEPDPEKALYDERQRLIRLEAGNHALYIVYAYLVVWLVLEACGVLAWPDRMLPLLCGGVILSLLVREGECILRDARMGYNQRKNEGGQIAAYFIMGACWMLTGALNLGNLSSKVLSMVQIPMGSMYLLLGGLMLYARRRRRLAESRLDDQDGGS